MTAVSRYIQSRRDLGHIYLNLTKWRCSKSPWYQIGKHREALDSIIMIILQLGSNLDSHWFTCCTWQNSLTGRKILIEAIIGKPSLLGIYSIQQTGRPSVFLCTIIFYKVLYKRWQFVRVERFLYCAIYFT